MRYNRYITNKGSTDMIFTKQIRTVDNAKEFQVRMFGFNFWITEDELKEEIKKGQVFFKANKPVELKDVA
jgi:hypothetical protein